MPASECVFRLFLSLPRRLAMDLHDPMGWLLSIGKEWDADRGARRPLARERRKIQRREKKGESIGDDQKNVVETIVFFSVGERRRWMFVHIRRGNLAIDILSCVPVGRLSLGIASDSVGCPLLRGSSRCAGRSTDRK